jgi:hypothetical protein
VLVLFANRHRVGWAGGMETKVGGIIGVERTGGDDEMGLCRM